MIALISGWFFTNYWVASAKRNVRHDFHCLLPDETINMFNIRLNVPDDALKKARGWNETRQ
ncbi:MAG TPA: hypothetical protein VIH57_12795 [Bacteroidales bacterium]